MTGDTSHQQVQETALVIDGPFEVEGHFGVMGASLGDILRVLNSDKPYRGITEQLAALDALEDWTWTELQKWRHAAAIAQMGEN